MLFCFFFADFIMAWLKLTNIISAIHCVKLWNPHERVKAIVEEVGFGHIFYLLDGINLCLPLFKTLASRYDHNENTFVLNGHKFYFGLKDVLLIARLPIVGKPIIMEDIDEEEHRNLVVNLLREAVAFIECQINLSTLRKAFANEEVTNGNLQQVSKVYLLYLIGHVIILKI